MRYSRQSTIAIITWLWPLLIWCNMALADDALLNLRDPAATSALSPTIRIFGPSDNGTNPANKLPTLPCVATAAAPSYTEGRIVPCSSDLSGAQRMSGTFTVSPSGVGFFAVERADITTASVNIAFGLTSKKLKLVAPTTNTADVCISYTGGTAVCPAANTAGNDKLKPGLTMILDDFAVTNVSVIAASGTQTVQVTAWN